MAAGLWGFVEYPTQQLTSGLAPIGDITNSTNIATNCIKPGAALPGFNNTKLIRCAGLRCPRHQHRVHPALGAGGRAAWSLGFQGVDTWAHTSARRPLRCPHPVAGQPLVNACALVRTPRASAALRPRLHCHPCRDFQCSAYSDTFVSQTWTLRVSLAVYVMALQSVMGEPGSGLHAPCSLAPGSQSGL